MYLLPPLTVVTIFLCLPRFSSTSLVDESYQNCSPYPYHCGDVVNVIYPFLAGNRSTACGYPQMKLFCEDNSPRIVIESVNYTVKRIRERDRVFTAINTEYLATNCPQPLTDTNIGNTSFEYGNESEAVNLLYNCSRPVGDGKLAQEISCLPRSYYLFERNESALMELANRSRCETRVQIMVLKTGGDEMRRNGSRYGEVLKTGFDVKWRMGAGWCTACVDSGGICGFNSQVTEQTICYCRDEPRYASCPVPGGKPDTRRKIIIGVSAGIGSFILAWLIFYFHQLYRRKRLASSSTLVCRDGSDPSTSSRHDLEKSASTHYAATHKFSYKELSEATNSFDTARELGNGGFGTVYFGKLRDGRCVAVKRLYDNHYKRKELFLNEVKILSGLRHQNLVSLYGCTSRHSRELLLVYEYVPNGTVADHLHGHRAKETALTWPIRMSIAIETAEALAYLHAVDPPIIHRDVKTDNILLDSNFRVKVADLGLSRLFPTDATHVSTVPQGTPGYVDPDYHKCYQLTCKSDVYSYGVVLMELISSMPAVDISRHQHEIKLSTLAVNKILKRALHELVDPNLGYGSDSRVTKMIRFIAELGFRCLQEEKDMRPSMEEVVMELKNMEADEFSVEKKEMGVKEVDNQTDDLRLLKSAPPLSPNSVMEKWINSENTTPSTSAIKKKALFLSSMWLC